jgi:hypothetical protein
MWSKNNNSIVFNGGIIMCRKFIFLISFVLVFSLAGSAIAFDYYDYRWNSDGNSWNDGVWNHNKVVGPPPRYNWQRTFRGTIVPPALLPAVPVPDPRVWVASNAPENTYSNDIWLTGTPNTRVKDVNIPVGYTANCSAHAYVYQTVFGPEWGLKLDLEQNAKLGVAWAVAPMQGGAGLVDPSDPCDPCDVDFPEDSNRSVVNMWDGSQIYGPTVTAPDTQGRIEAICIGLWWEGALPFVTWNMYGTSAVYTNALIIGGHLNMYGGTMDVLNYVNVATRDAYTVEDKMVRINIEKGKLILPDGYAGNVTDWVNRGMVLVYGKPPWSLENPLGGKLIIDTITTPGRTIVTANPPNPPEATEPDPGNGDVGVYRLPVLSWTAGKYAYKAPPDGPGGGHKVYFDDVQAKVDARQYCDVNGTVTTDPAYQITPSLESLKTYYWAVDEVNDTCSVSPWPGPTWKFTVIDESIIDAFEAVGSGYTKTGMEEELENWVVPSIADDGNSLRRTWIDGFWTVKWFGEVPTPGTSGSYVQLNTDTLDGSLPFSNKGDIALSPTQSMKLYYDNDGVINWVYDLQLPPPSGIPSPWNYASGNPPNYYSEVSAAIDGDCILRAPIPPFSPENQDSLNMKSQDWSAYKVLKIPYYGDPNNTVTSTDKLYVGIRDKGDRFVTVSNPDPNIIKLQGWHYWYVPLQSFKDKLPALNLSDVNRIYLGVGNRDVLHGTQKSSKGAIFFDDLQLLKNSVCVPGGAGDFNGDCKVDANDLQKMTQIWLVQPTPPKPVVDINTSSPNLPLGTLHTWKNNGSGNGGDGGLFKDFNSIIPGYMPRVQMVEGVKAVVFDGNDIMRSDFNTPATITGNHAFTAIYKVWNLDIGVEEWIIQWSRRGGPNGTYAAAGYGTHKEWGVAAHWGGPGPDMGFDPNNIPAAHTWHTIAFTYPGGLHGDETVMVDGVVNVTEPNKNLNIWPNNPLYLGSACDGNTAVINPWAVTPVFQLSAAVASVKIYSVAMSINDLKVLTNTPVDMKQDYLINFKDFALFANHWYDNLFIDP